MHLYLLFYCRFRLRTRLVNNYGRTQPKYMDSFVVGLHNFIFQHFNLIYEAVVTSYFVN